MTKEATSVTSMTPNQPLRSALVLALSVAALATPAVALGNSNPGPQAPDWFERAAAGHASVQNVLVSKQAPDWFERAAAAHASVQNVLVSKQAPDWFERYAAAHPLGHGVRNSSGDAQPRLVVVKPIPRLFVDDWFRDSRSHARNRLTKAAHPVTALPIDDWFRDSSRAAQPRAAHPVTKLFVDDWFRDANRAVRARHTVAKPVTRLSPD